MNKALFIAVLYLAGGFTIAAQETRKARADSKYEKFAYIRASELYEKLVEAGYQSNDLYGKLADTHYFNARYADALPYYRKMLEGPGDVEAEYYYRYAQCLKAGEKYKEAGKMLNRFYELVGKPKDEKSLAEAVHTLKNNKKRFTLKDAGVNTAYADFGTAYNGEDKVIFASARDTGIFVKRTHKWNEKPFLKLYSATVNSDGLLENPEKVAGDVNSKYHQSTPVITRDGKTMYFTRNNYRKGQYGKAEDGTNHLKIYRATLKDGKWGNIEDLSVNNEAYSTAHPALNADENLLYFVSDRSGTLGSSDLFVTEIKEDGSFGEVRNLGSVINTPGRESFPFVDETGVLYFASDGHPGLGGLDVFAAIKDPFGSYRVVNLGNPVNSTADDFAYITRRSGEGFLSSNRGEASGFDNIYSAVTEVPLAFNAKLCGEVKDSITKNPLSGAEVILYDNEHKELASVQTDASGNFCISVWPFAGYNLRAGKEDYRSKEKWIKELDNGETREVVIELNREDIRITTGDDLTKKLALKPIYFDFDGAAIRKRSEIELAKVIAVMKKYPDIVIEVRSHTDSRGSDAYNRALSERRAKATVDYIVNEGGVSPDRISGKGYGETRLINHCSDGVSCSAEEHQLNRRSEFILIKM